MDVELTQVDALVAGLPQGGLVRCLVMTAADMPDGLWDRLVAREPVTLVAHLDDRRVTRIDARGLPGRRHHPGRGRPRRHGARAGDQAGGRRARARSPRRSPAPRSCSAGGCCVSDDVNEAVGQVTALSALDNVVVIGHDDRLTGATLEAALAGPVGYIGSVGPRRLQDSRADWLVRRGVEDLDRIHGPAGLDIGARTPAEIAVSVLAEALAVRR